METLKQLLEDAKIKLSSTNLNAEIKSLGYDPKNLTDEQVNLIFEHFKTKQSNNKPAATKGELANFSQDAISTTSSDLKTGIDAAKAELEQIKVTVREVANEVSEVNAQEIYATIKAIPTMTLGRVKQLLDTANGDLSYFRKSPENLKGSLLAEFGIK